MNNNMWLRLLVAGCISVGSGMIITGCESDDDSSTETPDATEEASTEGDDDSEDQDITSDMSGTWNGTRSSSGGSTSIQMSLNHNDRFFEGEYRDNSGFEGDIDGVFNEGNVAFAVILTAGDPGTIWQFNGGLSEDGTILSGTMTTPSGDDAITATK